MDLLDALRGLTAVGVVLVHFTLGMKPTLFQQIARLGWAGIAVFFVISGFVIPYSLARSGYRFPGDYGRFLLKRIIRLHPPYLLSVLILIALSWVSFSDAIWQFIIHAGLLNGFLGQPWLNQVYWTLAIEFQFYLVIGVLVPVFLRGPGIRLYLLLASLLCVSLVPAPEAWIIRYLPLFVLGILVFLRKIGTIHPLLFHVGLLAASAVCAFSFGPPQAVVGFATALCITHARFRIPKVLSGLGEISYSLYLLHLVVGGWIIGKTFFTGIESMSGQILAVSAALGVSCVLAWVSYRLVEKPCQRASSRISYVRDRSVPEIVRGTAKEAASGS